MRTSAPASVATHPVAANLPALEEQLASLLPEERALLGAGAVVKRRAEFAAGRIAARRAVAALLHARGVVAPARVAILRDEAEADGRPRVVTPGVGTPELHLSISHVDGLAIAAAGTAPLGIDLVVLEPLSAPTIESTFAPGELEVWRWWLDPTIPDVHVASIAFGAKEAALKWLGTGMRVPLQSVTVTPLPDRGGCVAAARELRVLIRSVEIGWELRAILDGQIGFLDRSAWVMLGAWTGFDAEAVGTLPAPAHANAAKPEQPSQPGRPQDQAPA